MSSTPAAATTFAGDRGLLLVTGGAGFIGSAIVTKALDEGWRVRVLDNLRADVHAVQPATGTYFVSPFADSRVDFLLGDVTDPAAVADALQGVTVVSHQAAKVGLGVDISDAPDYVASNDLGTAVLLAAMARADIKRLVLASSMVVYGEGKYRRASTVDDAAASGSTSDSTADYRALDAPAFGAVRPAPRRVADLEAGRFDPVDPLTGEALAPDFIVEDDPLDPRNVYASTKLAQEHLASAWARSTGGRVIALRYHNVYGPGMPQNTPYAGVASLFRSALERGEAPRVFEDGGQRRDFVHVRDVAGANLAAIDATNAADSADAAGFRAYNVGSGDVHTIGDLASALSRFAGGPEPVFTGEFRLGDVRHITASSERLRSELGWRPTMSFDDGMREFATAPLRAAVGS
ncbi:MAG: NAD-dependent dehydratase [Subtercola sp.]|nr:NAD-dependent dehydratase [Subtercola sp.]